MQNDLARAVESAGAVILHLALCPTGQPALPDLPLRRRVVWVNARAARRVAVERDRQHVAGVVGGEREIEGVTGTWLCREKRDTILGDPQLTQVVCRPGSGVAVAGVARVCACQHG